MIKTLIDIIISFGKIGFVSLGGGNSMLKLLEVETVQYRHWIQRDEFVQILGTSYFFPGLTCIKLAALIGYQTAGILGLILAILALNLPGLLLALIGYQFLTSHNSELSRKIMIGVQYGALALLASACVSVGQGVIAFYYSLSLIISCVLFFLALTFLQVSSFWGFLVYIFICIFLIR